MGGANKLGVTRWKALALIAAAILAVRPARASSSDAAEQTRQSVARALNLSGRDSGGLKILRSPLPANIRIHALSVQPAPGSGTVLVRLACDDSRDCLPFYAVMEGTKSPLPVPPASLERVSSVPAAKPLLRAGDRVDIVEQLSGMNLRSRGVCLQAGSIGNAIRVRTLTNHRVLVATVEAPNMVKVER